jgi:hypothetical protein
MADCRVFETLICEKWNEVIPEDAADHRWHDGTAKLLLDTLHLINQHPIILFNLWM